MSAQKTKGYIGRAIKRLEDPRLIKGIATYVDDISLPGMLHAMILRSPHAHARIGSVKTGAAAKGKSGKVLGQGFFSGHEVHAGRAVIAIPGSKGVDAD